VTGTHYFSVFCW